MSREKQGNRGSMDERKISRKNFLRAGGLGMAGAALFGATACGGEEQGGGQTGAESSGMQERSDIRIVMATHGPPSDPFFTAIKNGLDRAAEDMGEVTAEYRAPESFDIAEVQQIFESVIATKPDGLAVTIADPSALQDQVQQAVDQGIPVVVLNTGKEVWQEVGALTYVGQTPYQAGLEAGKRMAQEGVTNALCINHQQGQSALEARCNGFTEGMGGANVSQLAVQGDNPTSAQNAIEQRISGNTDLDGLLTLGPQGALPMLKAVSAQNMNDQLKLATFDLGTEVLQAVSDGELIFAIDQQPFLQGYLPIVFLTNYIQYGVAPVNEIQTGPAFVTQQEADDVLDLTEQGIR